MADAGKYALFGHPVSHSRSPAIHHAFAAQAGETIHYELVDVAPKDFETRLKEFFSQGGRGGNVTLPHKLAAFEFSDHVSSDAYRAGAVNTLALLDDGSIFGDNTDGAGLVRDLTVNHGIVIEGRRLLLIGAGGAARGALGPLLDEGPAEMVIANRHPGKAALLAQLFREAGPVRSTGLDTAFVPFDLVINATSASLADAVPDLGGTPVAAGTAVYDMVYKDAPTAFMQLAEERGAKRVMDGWGMMVEQAAESFFIWRGVRPDTSSLLKAGIRNGASSVPEDHVPAR